jgi:hypothetical protein
MFGSPSFALSDLFYVALIGVTGLMVLETLKWGPEASEAPVIVGTITLICAFMSLVYRAFHQPAPAPAEGEAAAGGGRRPIHMDLVSEDGGLAQSTVLTRGLTFFAWFAGFMLSMRTIGLIPTSAIYIIAYMWVENREPWRVMLPMAAGVCLFIYVVFDQLLSIPWPATFIGTLFPYLHHTIPSV